MSTTSTYLLEYAPVEADRLLAMAELLAPEVRATCERAGLRLGGRAIDVGCGPLGALVALHGTVGAGGEVVGIDANPLAVDSASAIVDHAGMANVRTLCLDINDSGVEEVLEPASFDLAFCRLMLMHQAEPSVTLRRIAELVRPGGSVVAFDLLRPPLVEPASDSVDRAWDLIIQGMRRIGAHPETSQRYPLLAAEAGLEVVSQRGVFMVVPPFATFGETTSLLHAATRSLVARGLVTAAEVDDIVERLPADQAETAFATTPFAVEMIARKPG